VRSDAHRVVETCRAVAEAGADGVVVGNALPAAMPGHRRAGLSGPAIRPLALLCVEEVTRALPDVSVVASGGIMGAVDARFFLEAGARAIQIGTALFHDPTTAHRVAAELLLEETS
jgi:dihydroorotate dehydrogenase (NAD+) catalytic subunit